MSDLCLLHNATREDENENRQRLVAELFGKETDAWVQPPFFCDYGTNIDLGFKVFFNFNCVVLDVAQVTIGSNVLFGPSVQIYTATHPSVPRSAVNGWNRQSRSPSDRTCGWEVARSSVRA